MLQCHYYVSESILAAVVTKYIKIQNILGNASLDA